MERLPEKLKELYEKVVKLTAQGVLNSQIALAVGVTENELWEHMQTEEFREIAAPVMTEFLEQQVTVNAGWDSVEESALATVVTHLQHRKDPDYALRAAMVANRAQRRQAVKGSSNNQTLSMQAGARVVISLETSFVQGIGGLKTSKRDFKGITIDQQKEVDMLSTADVNKMLDKPLELDVEELAKMVQG